MKQRKILFYDASDPNGFDIDRAKSIYQSRYQTEGYFSTSILVIPKNMIIPILNDVEKSMECIITDKTFVMKTHSTYSFLKSKTDLDSCDDELLYIDTDRIKKLCLYHRRINKLFLSNDSIDPMYISSKEFREIPYLNVYLEGRDQPIKLHDSFEVEEFKKFLNKIGRYDLLLNIS